MRGAVPALGCALCLPVLAGAGSQLRGVRFYDFPDVGDIRGLPHFCIFTDTDAPYYNDVRGAVQDLARREQHRALAFVEVKTDYPDTFKFFNFHPEDNEGLPFAIVVNWTNGMGNKPYLKYSYAADTEARRANISALQDVDGMARFVGDFFDGALLPWARTEQVLVNLSDYSPKEGAFQVVQSQFAEVVLTSDVDVLVMFFAPWCGFSKRMQPRIDDLARSLRHVNSLRIVKIDLTLNDISHPVLGEMSGYPFLAMFPAGKKDDAEVVHVEADVDEPSEWRSAAVDMLRRLATHPIPDSPPPMVADADSQEDAATAFRDLEEM